MGQLPATAAPTAVVLRRRWPALSPRLRASLTRSSDALSSFDDIVGELAGDAGAIAELGAVASDLEAMVLEAGADGVIAALTPLLTVYPVNDAVATPAWWRLYVEALTGYAPCVLQAAVKAYVSLATSQYFPKPGELVALARKAQTPEWTAVGRCRKALRLAGERAGAMVG